VAEEVRVWGLIGVVLLGIGIMLLALWELGHLFPRQPAAEQGAVQARSPLEVLAMRYARGEISATQYEQMRQALETDQVSVPTIPPQDPAS